jgi:ADP-ribose pyrophosphatase
VNDSTTVQPWSDVASRPLGDYRIFQLRAARRRSPRTGSEHDFYVIDCANWVNVVALTPDDQLVMVEQFRHGTSTIELEIPGGIMDPEESDPVAAGLRELREETGFVGRDARLIGHVFPNSAIQSNTCFTVCVRDCRPEHALELDPSEDIAVRLVPRRDIPGLIASQRIRHSLVVAALYHFDLAGRTV